MPGADLAERLESVDRRQLDGHDLVKLIRARSRLLSWMQAQLWADIAALGDGRLDGPMFDHADPAGTEVRTPDEFAADELRPALCLTRRGAETCFGYAWDVCLRLPRVWEAVAAGELDKRRAEIFVDETQRLTGEQARLVADKLVGKAGGWTTTVLRRRIRELVMVVAPQDETERHRDAVRDRVVWGQSNEDGTITITGDRLPTIEAAKAMARIRGLARAYRAAGDPRNLDQLAADLYLALLNGAALPDPNAAEVRWDGPTEPTGPTVAPEPTAGCSSEPAEVPRADRSGLARLPNGAAVVELTVPLTTLMGLAETPGDLAGWGPVVADIARQFARDHRSGQWRWTVIDPETGAVLGHDITRRRPDAANDAFTRARDRTCRSPGCAIPARSVDLDHTSDYVAGGPSAPSNLGPLCRHDHRLKHEAGWRLTQPVPGVFEWVTRAGHRYRIDPDPVSSAFEPDWTRIARRGLPPPPIPQPPPEPRSSAVSGGPPF